MTILTAGDYDGLPTNFVFTFGDPPSGHRVVETTPTLYAISNNTWSVSKFYGSDLTYDDAGRLTGGVVTGWEAWGPMYYYSELTTPANAKFFSLEGFSVPAMTLATWIADTSQPSGFNSGPVLFAGDDSLLGGVHDDYLVGHAGNDTVIGGDGADVLVGGSGVDFSRADVVDPLHDASNYLRGDDGDDQIYGGGGFDDINGNRGNDTAHGGPGDDWVVGGKDSDLLFGDEGSDIVLGNLGADTLDGGAGADVVRGGQGDDLVYGGGGDDWLSGDRGSDTISGGAGGDVFHTFGDAGLDRVLDFNRAEGDRVQLDPGTSYTVSQVGADTVIDMPGGAQVVLVGVSMASLTDGWLVEA